MMPDEPTKETNLSNASLLQSAKKHVMPFVPEGQSPFYVIFYLLLIYVLFCDRVLLYRSLYSLDCPE